MKRAIAVLLSFLLVLSAWALCLAETKNLLANGSFEQLDGSGNPIDWYANAYRGQAGYSRIAVTDAKAHSGRYSAMIENASSNDARFICTADVKPQALYRLSGYILVDHMEDVGNGANLALEGIYAFSDCLFDTAGEWQYVEWYGETGPEQTELTFGVRVGGYSAESVGKAYFDDIALEEVNALPQNVIASVWYDAGSSYSSSQIEDISSETASKKTVLFVAIAVLFALFVLWGRNIHIDQKHFVFVLMMAAGLLVRLILAAKIPGYDVDINCFKAWSMRMAAVGPAGFYSPDYFCDYPPGAMLLLWPVGVILSSVRSSSAVLLTVKSLPVICDMLAALLLYLYACKKSKGNLPIAAAAFYLFNPAVLVNGAAWGQVDSVLALFIMLTVFQAMDRRWHLTIPLFIVSVLVKPQALLFAPVGGMWLLFDLFGQDKRQLNKSFQQVVRGLIAGLLAALVIVIPFSLEQPKPFTWLFELYGETLSSYKYATLNTANLYYLIGANWTGLDNIVPVWLPFITAALLVIFALLLRQKEASAFMCWSPKCRRLLSTTCLGGSAAHLLMMITGETYAMYGYAMMVLVYVFALLCLFEKQNDASLPLHMAIALMGIYVLGVKVHERYLFPALLLLLIAYVRKHDKRILYLLAGFSATTFVNTAIVLENSILFGAAQGHLNTDTYWLNMLLCLLNLTLFGYAVWVGLTGLKENTASFCETDAADTGIPEIYRRLVLQPSDARMHLKWFDFLVMGITICLYSILTFANLGSTAAPQTAWVSTSADEQVVLDLGQKQDFSVLYYAGVSYNPFSISVSDDGVNWSEDYPCQMREGLCWQWRYAVTSSKDENGNVSYAANTKGSTLQLNGRYLRVNACEAGLNLWEIVARDPDGNNIPLRITEHTGAYPELLDTAKPAANLCDEMHTCVGEPSWYNSMYFDEIYHAREAYHNLHGERTYEWTHPPLGKLLIAIGIAIFGMTPFGWRFAGALIGVLMLPALYLLGMQLTKKRSIAVVSMLAFALDLMHFTQTRIATIDSFPLLFILLSYVCMVRYMQTDLLKAGSEKDNKLLSKAFLTSLVPLFLCGLFMSLSIASKWTGCYSAVGLAVLFFISIYRQARLSTVAYELELKNAASTNEQKARIHSAETSTTKRILLTCCCCVVFFVAMPLLIYYVSYIPQLIPDGPATIRRVMNTQKNMLSYHSTPGLGMDHPFQSPWWQWPFILKPIWYVQDAYEPAGFASTIMCLGNPWVFYIGAFAMIGVLIAFAVKYVRFSGGKLTVRHGDGDLTLLTLVVAFLAQYLPWMLVPRSMYIYHYFASVPFIILSTSWFISLLPKDKPRLRNGIIALYLIGAVVFFVMFFPYASGRLTSTTWLDAMKWFSRLYY